MKVAVEVAGSLVPVPGRSYEHTRASAAMAGSTLTQFRGVAAEAGDQHDRRVALADAADVHSLAFGADELIDGRGRASERRGRRSSWPCRVAVTAVVTDVAGVADGRRVDAARWNGGWRRRGGRGA